MKDVFELRRQTALALRPNADPFATMVDLTDEGLNIEDISAEFLKLRRGIVEIRRKIEENPAEPKYLFTEVGVGYRIAESD
jgi:Zn-dependent M32 family carboxypeptidase